MSNGEIMNLVDVKHRRTELRTKGSEGVTVAEEDVEHADMPGLGVMVDGVDVVRRPR